MNRRKLLGLGSAFPLAYLLEAHALQATVGQSEGNFDQETFDFWTKVVRSPNEALTKGIQFMGAAPPEPAFVYWDPTAKTFTPATEIDNKDLPASGDATVNVNVQRFRLSTADAQAFAGAQTGSLRIDVGQASPLPGLTEALAWSAVAAFVPKAAGQLPSLDKLSFDPGKTWNNPQSIPLPKGAGFWSWNFFLKKPEHLWGKFVRLFTTTGEVVFPLLGMPAIALTALKAVDKMLGYVQSAESSTWLLKSASKPVYATKAGQDQAGTDAIRLRTGTYLVMPENHLSKFGAARNGLEIRNGGYVVPQKTDSFQVIDAAQQAIPDVTYLAVSVSAQTNASDIGPKKG